MCGNLSDQLWIIVAPACQHAVVAAITAATQIPVALMMLSPRTDWHVDNGLPVFPRVF